MNRTFFAPFTPRRHVLRAIAVATACVAVAGCSTAPLPTPPAAPKPTFVLVHGAFQDERAWSDVKPKLEAAGHKVVAVRLAGRAGDTNPPVAQITLDTYRQQVASAVMAEPAPVVLVGHSFGGITIANVAEGLPERIRELVFVAAFLPQAGVADQSMAKISEADRWNGFNKERQNFILAKDYQTAGVLPEDVVMLFCGDCSPADQARTQRNFHQAEPLKPAATPVVLTAERYGRVPKVYLKTLRDRAVSPQMQQAMIDRTPVRRVVEIDAGHSPFLSQPDTLARALLAAAN
jgi:pimeloyl-ACP methyl ester carboxylesterase